MWLHHYIYRLLVGGIPSHLKNMSLSVGMTFPTEWEHQFHVLTTTNQTIAYDSFSLLSVLRATPLVMTNITMDDWLVVYLPLGKILVNWDDEIPN